MSPINCPNCATNEHVKVSSVAINSLRVKMQWCEMYFRCEACGAQLLVSLVNEKNGAWLESTHLNAPPRAKPADFDPDAPKAAHG